MAETILGTNVVEFVGDGTKFLRSVDQVEKRAVAAGASMARSLGVSAAKGIDQTTASTARLAPEIAKVEKGFEAARAALPKLAGAARTGLGAALNLTEKLASGAVLTERDLQRVRVALMRMKTDAIASFGSVEKASDEAKESIHAMDLALERGTDELRKQKNVAQDARGELTQAGVQFRGFGNALEQIAGKQGAIIAKAGVVALALRESFRLFKAIGEATGVNYKPAYALLDGLKAKLAGAHEKSGELLERLMMIANGRWDLLAEDIKNDIASRGGVKRANIKPQFGPPKPDADQLLQSHVLTNLRLEEEATERLRKARIRLREEKERGDALMARVDAAGRRGLESDLASSAKRQGARATADALQMLIDMNRALEEAERSRMSAFSGSLAVATARYQAETGALTRLAEAYAQHAGTVQASLMSGLGSVENFLTDVLTPGAIRSFEDIEDAAKNMLRSIAAEIARMMAQRAVQALLRSFAPNYNSTAIQSMFQAASIGGFANGGVVPGGFRAFASGGIVDRPTLGLVGEGRQNEAVVPLPDGRSIPVEMRGGGQRQPVNVEVVLGHGFMTGIVRAAAEAAAPSDNRIIMVVGENILRNGSLRKLIQTAV